MYENALCNHLGTLFDFAKSSQRTWKDQVVIKSCWDDTLFGKTLKIFFLSLRAAWDVPWSFFSKKYSGGKIQDCSHANKKIIFPPTISIKILMLKMDIRSSRILLFPYSLAKKQLLHGCSMRHMKCPRASKVKRAKDQNVCTGRNLVNFRSQDERNKTG